MTIAVGILGAGFAVVGADTEMSYGDLTKISKTKVFPVVDGTEGSDGIMVATGAGDTNYIEGFIDEELMHEFLCAEDLNHFEDGIKSKLVNFIKYHSVPQDAVSLIVAAQRRGKIRIWSTYGSTVRSCLGSIAVGIGESYARTLLLGLPVANADETTAQLVATFAINRTKGFVQGCGKDTEVVSMKRGSNAVGGFSGAQTRGIENVFDRYRSIESAALCRMLYPSNKQSVENGIDSLGESIRRIIEDGS
jgi:20S proteasome alpha/beta subunit